MDFDKDNGGTKKIFAAQFIIAAGDNITAHRCPHCLYVMAGCMSFLISTEEVFPALMIILLYVF